MRAPYRKWTSEEEEALETGIKKRGIGNWKMIQEDPEFGHSLAGRSNVDIGAHYANQYRRKEIPNKQRKEILKKQIKEKDRMGAPMGTWTSEEEEALIAGVNKHGAGKWKDIQNDPEYSHRLAGRSNVDLRNYYCYHFQRKLGFGISKEKWTTEEEEAFRAGVKKYGAGNWKIILNDPEYRHCLASRGFYDLKEKWRNMVLQDVTAPATTLEKLPETDTTSAATPKVLETQMEPEPIVVPSTTLLRAAHSRQIHRKRDTEKERMGARKWTAEKEEALEAGIRKHGAGNWKIIHEDTEYSHCLAARSNKDIGAHYDYQSGRKQVLKKQRTAGTPKVKWTTAEEEALIAGVNKHGTENWKGIQNDPEYSPRLAPRSNKDLRSFYDYHCRRKKTLKKERAPKRKWTIEEEEALKEILKKWRAETPILKWTSEEEKALKAGVNKHGTGNWRSIKKDPEFGHSLAARSNRDLKDKWRNMLGRTRTVKAATLKVPNTPASISQSSSSASQTTKDAKDKVLDRTRNTPDGKSAPSGPGKKRGNVSSGNSWFQIAERLPGRTANEIKNHWNTHLAKKIQDDSSSTRKSSVNSKKKKRMVKTRTLSQIVENCEKISGSTDHCKEMDLDSENGFLGCPLGGMNLSQTYEIDCCNGEICCFSEFCQLCSFSGEKTGDFFPPSSEASLLFSDDILQEWTGNDVLPSDIGSEEDRLVQ